VSEPAMAGIGPVGVWGHLDSLGAQALRAYAGRLRELGYSALWVPETVGREPFVALAAMSDVSVRTGLWLGTSIASIYARDAVTTRTAAMALHELTGGRFVLGLGVSHPHLVTKLRGHEYARPVTAMREYLAAYRATPYRGPRLHEDSEPPVVVAALREHMAALGATDADGAFPYLVTPARVTWMRGVVDGAAGRQQSPRRPSPRLAVTLPVALDEDPDRARRAARAYLAPYLRTPNYHASWAEQGFDEDDWSKPGSDRLVDAMVAWGSAGAVADRCREMLDAGAHHVALIPLAPDGETEENVTALEAVAVPLAPLLRTKGPLLRT
jgi:probable F420-dependent oxidoreductase